MPAPVRYRSTAAVYDDGGANKGITRARGSPERVPAPEFGDAYTSPRRPE